jgi:hypothetical protein
MRMARVVSRWFLLFAVASCGKTPEPESETVPPAPPAPAAVSATTKGKVQADPCPATGSWAICAIEKRLKRSGFVATRIEGDSPARPGFSVKPVAYTLGHGRLELFIYPDEASLAADMATIDTVTVAPAGSSTPWPSPPGLIRSGNLAAVYMGQTPRQAERLQLAITAGAPLAR